MAKFKTTRKYKHTFDFVWVDEDGEEQTEKGCFAVFNIKPSNELDAEYDEAIKNSPTPTHAMLSVALDEFGGMALYDAKGKKVPDDLLTEAARLDPVIGPALLIEYNQGRSGIGLGEAGNSTPKT